MGLIDAVEDRRLDSVTELNRVALAKLDGSELDRALIGLCNRRGRSDAAYVRDALANVHPDDLAEALSARRAECICPADQPVCPQCGRRWAWMRRWSDGVVTYTSDAVVNKYRALYGEPEIPFERVTPE